MGEKGQRNIRISQCMIVKNEEKNIEQALSWGKGIVWEQIVVDTGSTDRTVEIAEKMGAKVYHFPWIDDFAAAKNFAIDKAGCEWIAFLDADEFFTAEDAGKLLNCIEKIQDTEYEGIMTGWVHLDNDGKIMAVQSQIRIFRNLPQIRYVRRIHEYLRVNGERSVRMADMVETLSIYHTGYGKRESGKKVGSSRNLRLLQMELKDHPDDYELHGLLANEYLAMDDMEQAEQSYRRSVALMPEEMYGVYDMTTSGTWYRLLELLMACERAGDEELLKIYSQAVQNWPEEADYDYLMGKYYVSRKDYRSAEAHLSRALELLEKYGKAAKSAFLSANLMKTYELLAICCFNNNNLAACVQITTMLLREDPYLMSTLVVMLSAFLRDPGTGGKGRAGAQDVAVFLGGNFYQFQSLRDRLFVLKAAIGAGYQELVKVMKETFAPQELAAVDQALGGALSKSKKRILLFYSAVESFNFFTDQLKKELEERGHEIYIMDLRVTLDQGIHADKEFEKFAESGVDMAVCFDGLAVRTKEFVSRWNQLGTVVVDIFMDPPLRFHPALQDHPEKYLLFCCDRENVEYVKQYFRSEVPHVFFMPHVGVLPKSAAPVIPYKDRKYDILFCGTYYRPQDQFDQLKTACPEDCDAYEIYKRMFETLKKNSGFSVWQAFLHTLNELNWEVSDSMRKDMLYTANSVDWAIRMYQRERVVSALAEAGLDLYLLGRGWENHPSVSLPNVHRIDDRVPYGETLAYMTEARINLNVMPGFKQGTHDRIFNTLLQHSVPLTDCSTWIYENFTDGKDIALYDLDHLEKLPEIARRLLSDTGLAETIITNGYQKVSESFTWGHCTDWILEAADQL